MSASLWTDAALPAVPLRQNLTGPVEVGVRFSSDSAGFVTGIRFYKGAGNTGTHIGSLWTATGTPLGSATFVGETTSGWQQVNFESPVQISSGTAYVVSYFSRDGYYSVDEGYFASQGVDSAPLHAPQDSVGAGNGLYAYSDASTFPTLTQDASNYWVDVVFDTTFTPQVTGMSAFDGEPNGLWDSNLTATFNGPMDPATISGSSVQLRDVSDAVVPADVFYDEASRTVTIDPVAALSIGSTYSLFVKGGPTGVHAITGTPLATDFTSSFQAVETSTYSIWSESTVPAATVSDTDSVEVGVKFRADLSGYVTGIRFYKGAGNVGTHVGNLWTSAGSLLASATFTDETGGGWQQVNFATPVAISAGTTYLASYHAPSGHYSFNVGYFADHGADKGPLHALQNGIDGGNGVFAYSTASIFPVTSANSNNYWVDPVFFRPTAPTTPDLRAADDSGFSNSDDVTNSTNPTFTGVAQPAGTVRIFANGVEKGSGIADELGNYNVIAAGLAERSYVITATSIGTGPDGALVTLSSPRSLRIRIDRSIATPPALDLEAVTDSGLSASDDLTNSAAPVFSGTAEPGSSVAVFSDTVNIGSAIAGPDGAYSFTAPALVGGIHAITVQATDTAGNVSGVSSALVVTIDRSSSLPSVPDLTAATDTGSGSTDNLTAASAPQFAGTADPGDTVSVFSDGVSIGLAVADPGGSYSLTAPSLAEGPHLLTAQAQDPAGNVSAASASLGVTIDRTAPTADVVDVTPDPRNTAVSQVQITFSEPVSGLALSSLQLTRNGAPVSLAGATLTGPAADGKTYTVGNLAGLTGTVGNYEVRFTAAGSGVQDAAGNVIAADASDTWAYVNAAPTNVSQSPLSATDAVGAYRTFTAVYRDNNGATDLSLVYLRVNDYIPIMLDCVYDAVANKLYVRSADGATLTGGFSPGSANVISNGHGSLDCSQTTVTPSGNTLTVDWRISLGQPLAGRNVLYLRARDKGGADTLYQRLSGGTWQITGSRAPAVNSVSPTSASGPAGTAQAFTATYSDPDGWENLYFVYLRLNADLPTMVDVLYHVPSGRVFLRNDAGSLIGGFAAGSANVISNSQGSVNCALISAVRSGTGITVNWSVNPNQVLAGTNRLFVRSLDQAGLDTGYVQLSGATFTVTGNRAPTNLGVSPATGTTAAGVYRTITASYSDPDGASNLNTVYLSINRNDAPKRLEAVYLAETNKLYLFGDDGVTLLGGFAPGSANVISNSRGSLNCSATTVSRSGNALTVNWSIAATTMLAGSNTITLRARDHGGLDTGFQQQAGVSWVIT